MTLTITAPWVDGNPKAKGWYGTQREWAAGVAVSDFSGPGASSDDLMYDSSLRDEDDDTNSMGNTIERWAREERAAKYAAYDSGSGTEQLDSVWVDDMLMNVVNLIDDRITRYYHAKLLNVYFDKKRGKLATGSVRFTVSPAGKPAFYCVRQGCRCQHAYEGFAGTALDFLWLAYVHGLNHGAAFGRPYGERVLNDPYLPA